VSQGECVVYVLDDDRRLREALIALLSSMGRRVVTFGNAGDFLGFERADVPSCLILDLQLPGMTGLSLLQELGRIGGPPVIILTGHGDIPSSVEAIRAGAIDYLAKPLDAEILLAAIDRAIRLDRELRSRNAEYLSIKQGYDRLTPRERDVMPYIVAGRLNKQTADELGTSEITVRIHRARIMRKMKAESLAHLVRMAMRLGIF
jgi:FixJ family two-component response regulator